MLDALELESGALWDMDSQSNQASELQLQRDPISKEGRETIEEDKVLGANLCPSHVCTYACANVCTRVCGTCTEDVLHPALSFESTPLTEPGPTLAATILLPPGPSSGVRGLYVALPCLLVLMCTDV